MIPARTLVAGMWLALAGCQSFSGIPGGAPQSSSCSPQLPAGYRIQVAEATGILEVRVVDAAGAPQASASVAAIYQGTTGTRSAQCIAMVGGNTDAAGLVRFERMKVGPYSVMLQEEPSATSSAVVEAGKTSGAVLTRKL